MQTGSKRNLVVSTLVIGATALLIVGAVVVTKKDSNQNNTSTATTTPAVKSSTDSSSSTSNSNYKDGTYSAVGSYDAPDGTQEIGITMTISNGTVTATSAENKANGRDSYEYEARFISDYQSSVVGRKIDNLKGMISGDSLTLAGFEDALSQIEQQARV